MSKPDMRKSESTPNPWVMVSAALVLSAALTTKPASSQVPQGMGCPPGAWSEMPMAFRAADQRFITMMIPHHDSAIAMAELALGRARRPQIRGLAQQIKTSQSAENAQMRRWYQQWFGTEVPAWTTPGVQAPMGMGMGLPGMTTSLNVLRRAPDFDRAFIEQMIPHHRMGVMMASHAQWGTTRPELRQLEAAMVNAQSREIAQMEQWYRQWYGRTVR